MRKPPESLGAWEAYQQGLWHLANGGAESNDRARDHFIHAIALDRLFATPHAMLSYIYLWDLSPGRAGPNEERVALAQSEALRAIELDPDDPVALAVLSYGAMAAGNHDDSLKYAERSLDIAPNSVAGLFSKARALIFSGRPVEGRATSRSALRLSPNDPMKGHLLVTVAIGHYFERDYAEAADCARQITLSHPGFPLPGRWLAAALGQLVCVNAAREALDTAMANTPESFNFFVRHRPAWFRPEDHDHMLEGLRKAGWDG
jgi:adenylate cyclase